MKKEIKNLTKNISFYFKKFPLDIFVNKKGKMMSFIKEIKDVSNVSIIRLAGSIDANSIPTIRNNFKNKIMYLLDRNILLDLKEVTRIDSSALASFLEILNLLKRKHKKLALVNIGPVIMEYIKIAKLGPIIHIYETMEEALKYMSDNNLKVCPYFFEVPKKKNNNSPKSKCLINSENPIVPGRLDKRQYCKHNHFSICPYYKKEINSQKIRFKN